MSLPTAAFLDTSILAGQQYNFHSTALASFVPVAKLRAIKLLVPDPTEREVERQIRERSQEALAALEKARRHAPFLAKWKHFPQKAPPESEWDVRRIAIDEYRTFLGQFALVRLGYQHVDAAKIMRWYNDVTPPFGQGKKRKEFPDAFAVAMVEAYARINKCVVAVVSDDGDFRLACDRYSSLLYFRSLPALTELLLADASRVEIVRAAIMGDVSRIEESLAQLAQGLGYFHGDHNYKVQNTNVQAAKITDVRIVALGDGECTLTFEADIEAEHSLEWAEWNYERDDFSEEETSVLETFGVSGTAKVRLDASSARITDLMSIDTDDGEIEVTENPRRGW